MLRHYSRMRFLTGTGAKPGWRRLQDMVTLRRLSDQADQRLSKNPRSRLFYGDDARRHRSTMDTDFWLN